VVTPKKIIDINCYFRISCVLKRKKPANLAALQENIKKLRTTGRKGEPALSGDDHGPFY